MATAKKRIKATPGSIGGGGEGGKPIHITDEFVAALLKPVVGQPGAQLSLTIDGPISCGRLEDVQKLGLQGGRSKINLTIDLSKKPVDGAFTQQVIEFLGRGHQESLKIAVCAGCGSPPGGPVNLPPPPKKPKPPKKPGKKAPSKKAGSSA